MAILTKGVDFSSGDQVTSANLDNLVDAAAFVTGASGTTDDSSLEVNGSGRLQIKASGVSSGAIAASAVTTAKLANSTSTTDGVTFGKIRYMGNLTVIGNVSGSSAAPTEVTIYDEDDMASDSATGLASQQSIKAYITDNVTSKTDSFLPVAKAYCTISGGSLTVQASSGFSGIVRNSAGKYTATLSSARANANYIVLITKEARPLEGDITVEEGSKSTTAFNIENCNDNSTYADPDGFHVIVIP